MKNISLPRELEPFKKNIQQSKKPYIKVSGKPRNDLLLWESKFGGRPYMSVDLTYPKDKFDKPMKLLAQINFEEVPSIESFPEKGILQFYISAEDDVYGLNFDNGTSQENFKIMYIPNVIKDRQKLLTDFSFLDQLDNDYFPIGKQCKLFFEESFDFISLSDYRFEKIFNKSQYKFFEQFGDKENELFDSYSDNFDSTGHKIGGYAFFTQYDPRETEYKDHEVLLFQMDTDEDLNIMWGDGGVANFFIKRKDLEKLDFTNVLYNWDCY